MPAGKAIAMAAMPTAVLMGMGFTPTLALADEQPALQQPEGRRVQGLPRGAGRTARTRRRPPRRRPPRARATRGRRGQGRRPSRRRRPRRSADDPARGHTARARATPRRIQVPTTRRRRPHAVPLGIVGEGTVGLRRRRHGEPARRPRAAATCWRTSATRSPASSRRQQGHGEPPSPPPSPLRLATEHAYGRGHGHRPRTPARTTPPKKVTDTVEDTVEGHDRRGVRRRPRTPPRRSRRRPRTPRTATASPSPSASSATDPEDCPVATDDEGGVDNEVLAARRALVPGGQFADAEGRRLPGHRRGEDRRAARPRRC